MKTKLLFFAAIAALTIASCSKERETTEPTPPPTPDEELYDIYMAGTVRDGETDVSCYWKNGQLHELAVPNGIKHYTMEIAVSEGSVYVVGKSHQMTGYWKDGV